MYIIRKTCFWRENRSLIFRAMRFLVAAIGGQALWDAEEAQCDVAMREVMSEDRATVVDESDDRLHAIWVSQE